MNPSILVAEAPTTADNLAIHPAAGVSVDDALGTGILKQATLLAGKAGGHRIISGLLPVEVPDTSTWLKGGELVLTTGYVLRDAEEPWINFLKGLIEAGAAGLVVLASPYVKLIPDNAIALAERSQFPLMVMALTTPVVDVIKPLQEAIEAARSGAMREGLSLQRRLMQMVLDGAGLEPVAKFLGRQLEHTLVIEDKQFNLLAYAQHGTGPDPRLEELTANKGTPVALMPPDPGRSISAARAAGKNGFER